MIEFFVPGIARTAGSKSAFKGKDGRVHITHAGKYTKDWMDNVKWFALKKLDRMVLLTGPLKLKLVFLLSRPKGHYRTGQYEGLLRLGAQAYPIAKPDLTKLTRATEDALTGIVWKDDSQVVSQETSKIYCEKLDKPGVSITIEKVMVKGTLV